MVKTGWLHNKHRTSNNFISITNFISKHLNKWDVGHSKWNCWCLFCSTALDRHLTDSADPVETRESNTIQNMSMQLQKSFLPWTGQQQITGTLTWSLISRFNTVESDGGSLSCLLWRDTASFIPADCLHLVFQVEISPDWGRQSEN